MISKKNPFPGMNPYLESRWPDVHSRLIGYLADKIAARLPDGLVARAEERISVDTVPFDGDHYRSDVAVSELWKEGIPPKWSPPSEDGELVADEPDVLTLLSSETERWLEIRTVNGKVVTAIEILSPINKHPGRGRDGYLEKQAAYLNSDANLVIIDLLRGGETILPIPADAAEKSIGVPYHICVARAIRPYHRELYRIPLRQKLPVFRIPLRPTDPDLLIDLQPLIDRCYEMGGYWQQSYQDDPLPALNSPDDLAWIDAQLRAAGLRS